MSDLNKDLSKKFIRLLDKKEFKLLQSEVEKMENAEKQNPLVMFFYACSIFLEIPKNNSEEKNKKLLLASKLFEKVYTENKTNIQSLYNMIEVSFKTKVFKNVLILASSAYEKNRHDVLLIEGLARIHYYLGNIKVSIKFFKLLYDLLPEKIEWRLLHIGLLNYDDEISQKEYISECLKFYSILNKKFHLESDNFKFNSKKNTKIKISFLSGDFKKHSVSYFLKGLLNEIDQSIFEIHMISNLKILDQDNMTKYLKTLADYWHDVEHLTDDQLVVFLRSLNLNILIDLSGFTNGNRLVALARRCAKIQIEWLGYNNSLGLKNLDYLISDKNLIKSNELNLYSEKVIFLPKIWNAYSVPENLPDIKIKNNIDNEKFTFCSFNNFKKISDNTINVWSKILIETDSNILLKSTYVGGNDLKRNILKKFLNKGVNKDRIIFLNKENDIYDHLNLYNLANVALDTFPYPGITTSFEAIMMGLPVLTMRGYNFNSRCGESINKNLGMDYMIANDENDYVNKAILLTKDRQLKKNFGVMLRQKAMTSALFDTATFAKDFQSLMLEIDSQN